MPLDTISARLHLGKAGWKMGWISRRRAPLLAAAIVILASTLYVGLAAASRGFPAATVQLNDGSVWITQESQSGEIARLDRPIDQLDGGVVPVGPTFNVLQSGYTVLSYSTDVGVLRVINAATLGFGPVAKVPDGSTVSLGQGTVAIASGGDAWIEQAAALRSVSRASPELDKLGNDPATYSVVVGNDGVAHAYSSGDQTLSNISFGPNGTVSNGTQQVSVGGPTDHVTVSAVGGTPVILDSTTHSVVIPGQGAVTIPTNASDPGAVAIQQPGPLNSVVYVSSNRGLFAVPVAGGGAQLIATTGSVTGTPIQPVFLNGCVSAAWTKPAQYAYQCAGSSASVVAIPDVTARSQLVFRVNRDIVVLNDAESGNAWIWQSGLKQVANWKQFLRAQHADFSKSTNSTNASNADQGQTYHPPHANNVSLGARPGQTTLLPVLDFDSDPNGGVLTLTGSSTIPASDGTLQVVDNSTEFQLTTPATLAPGQVVTFPYSITDGLSAQNSSATVTVTIVPTSQETAPQAAGPIPFRNVTDGSTIQFNALSDWYDQEGDPFQLSAISSPSGAGDSVTFSPDGLVTLAADGAPGSQSVGFTVTDSRGESHQGQMGVSVGPAGQVRPPETTPFFAQAISGQPTILRPLSVDSDPNDYPLRLDTVTTLTQPGASSSGDQYVPNYNSGDVQFLAPSPGIYYLSYTASDIPASGSEQPAQSAATDIRVDVVGATSSPPVATQQVAYLPPGGSTTLPVLDDATDPSGAVLVVQSISAPPDAAVQAGIVQNQSVRLTANGELVGPVDLTYTISDGTNSSTAGIEVLPAQNEPATLPPVAEPVTAIVREGDVADINPLPSDFGPEGASLQLAPGTVKVNSQTSHFANAANVGAAFIDGQTIRYLAPPQTGVAQLVYGITDGSGQVVTSTVTIQVLGATPVTQAPGPEPLQASVIAGSTVTVNVPVDGVDPSGESVEFLGLASGPQKGTIVSSTSDSFTYQAFSNSNGTDTFTYAMRNRSGLIGDGTIRIGVAPPPLIDSPPIAVAQTVDMRPGSTMVFPVLSKDFDPQGYPIQFAPGTSLSVPNGSGLKAVDSGAAIRISAPSGGVSDATIRYSISDGHSAAVDGTLTVTTIPGYVEAPILHDIVVPYLSNPNAMVIQVNPLATAVDPDGSPTDLKVVGFAGFDSNKAPSDPNGVVTIHLTHNTQVIVYTVSGVDPGPTGEASATITVPPLGATGPQLRRPLPTITTPENKPLAISIGKYLVDPSGKTMRLSSASQISGADGSIVANSPSQFTFTPVQGYVGPASVTFDVTDVAPGPDDTVPPRTFTLHILVTGDNAPPIFYGPELSAVVGEHSSFKLGKYIKDSNPGGPDTVSISFASPPAGNLGASLSGQTLTLFPQNDEGDVTVLNLNLKDSHGATAKGAVQIDVVATNRPLAAAVPQTATVDQGKSVTINVLSADVNPYPASQPLKVLNPASLTPGAGQATTNGSTITFAASSLFSGAATVDYTLQDQSQLQSREVHGTVTINVYGVPGRPGAPNVVGYSSGTVLLSWNAPTDNGQTIDNYVVTGGPAPQNCGAATTCTITGLSNGSMYQFSVMAHNSVGNGQASAPSASVTPNTVPGTPNAPTATFGNGEINLSWQAPVNPGTPITCYQLTVSPTAGSSPSCIPGTSTSYKYSGLTNGVAYTFTLRAQNAQGFGPYSPPSAPQIPAGVPTAPGQPTASPVSNDPTGGKLTVTWPGVTGAAANGDNVATYTLNIYQGTTLVSSPTVTPTSPTESPVTDVISGLTNADSYTFTVTATNKAGTSPASTASAATTVFGQPGTVTDLSAASNQSGQTTLSYSPPNDNGQAISHYEYSLNGGPLELLSSNNVIGGLSNGQSYRIQIEACNTYCGSLSSPPANATPDAPPTPPSIGVSQGATTVTFSWGGATSNGCPISNLQWSTAGSGGPWNASGLGGGSTTQGNGYSQNYTVWVLATDSCGLTGESSAAGSTGPPPAPTITIGRGASGSISTCTTGSCSWLNVTMSNFAPNTPYTLNCYNNMGQSYSSAGHFSYTTNGSGGFSIQPSNSNAVGCIFGDPDATGIYVVIGGVQSNTVSW